MGKLRIISFLLLMVFGWQWMAAHPKVLSFFGDTEVLGTFSYCHKRDRDVPKESEKDPVLPATSSCLSGASDLFVAVTMDFDKDFEEVRRTETSFYYLVNRLERSFEIVLPPPRAA